MSMCGWMIYDCFVWERKKKAVGIKTVLKTGTIFDLRNVKPFMVFDSIRLMTFYAV